MFSSINTNLSSLAVANNLHTHFSSLATSTTRLSSGLRISSAADDTAGLAIRELMRADISALNQGVRNANDAISMLQTFDGALGIIDEKLIRMKELAEQAATGTYDSTQRLMIDSEFQAMGAEIDRIANATDFNGIKLINFKSMPKEEVEPYEIQTDVGFQFNNILSLKGVDFSNYDLDSLRQDTTLFDIEFVKEYNKGVDSQGNLYNIFAREYPYIGWNYDVEFKYINGVMGQHKNNPLDVHYLPTKDAIEEGMFIMADDSSFHKYIRLEMQLFDEDMNPVSDIPEGLTWTFSASRYPKKIITVNGQEQQMTVKYNYGATDTSIILSNEYGEIKISFAFREDSERWEESRPDYYIHNLGIKVAKVKEDDSIPDDIVKIHFGTMNDKNEDYYYINKTDATLEGLGIEGIRVHTQDGAQQALTEIDSAIIQKNKIRAYFGTMQNRLENTISNLTIQSENLQAAESRISDADIATEMTNFVRNQILTQSAVAMLSQANSLPQMVMQLIRQ